MEGRGVTCEVSCGVENIFSNPGGSFSGVVPETGVDGDSKKCAGGAGPVIEGEGVGLVAGSAASPTGFVTGWCIIPIIAALTSVGLVADDPGRFRQGSWSPLLELWRQGCGCLRFLISSRLAMRRFSASSHRCQVGSQASTAASHCGFINSSAVEPRAFEPRCRWSSRNLMRCLVTISTLRRTECHEYERPSWVRLNSAAMDIHHLHRLLRLPKVSAFWLQISKSATSSLVVRRLCCREESPSSSSSSL